MSDETTKKPPSMGQRLHDLIIGDRDPVLLLLIAIILLGVNGYGVVSGMNMILPLEPSLGAGIVVCGLLFAFEAGYAGRHSKRIKQWGVVLLIPFVVFWMFTRYYFVAASFRDAGELISFAATPHSDLVTTVYTPKKAVSDSLARRSDEKYAASERERSAGTGTGARGYGPRAQALQREGDELRDQAAEYTAILELQKPYADIDTATISPEKTYEMTLALWRVTPEFTTTAKGEILMWKCLRLRDGTGTNGVPPLCAEVIPQPTREQFVDETRQNPVLTPTLRLMAGDPVAWAVLLISLFFDGVALIAGTAIVKKEEPEPVADNRSMVHRASDWVLGARQASKTIQYARQMPVEHIDIRDPLRTMQLRLRGERHAADFYNLLYRHTHPLSGRFDWRQLMDHENESYKDMARWFVDAARANGLLVDTGAEDEDEALYFPQDSYFVTTSFFREGSLREVAFRDKLPPLKEGQEPERVMRVLLPEPIVRAPDQPIKLMRPLPGGRSAVRTIALTAPVVGGSAPPVAAPPVPAQAAPPVPLAIAPVVTQVHVPRAIASAPTLVPTEPHGLVNGTAHLSADDLRLVAAAPVLVAPAVAVVDDALRVDALVSSVSVDAWTMDAPPNVDPHPTIPIEELLEEEDDLDAPTQPSLMMDRASLLLPPEPAEDSEGDRDTVLARPEPEAPAEPEPPAIEPEDEVQVPFGVDSSPPPPKLEWVPEFDPTQWDDRPTGATVVTGLARTRGEEGLVLRDDALRQGRVLELRYKTQPPRLQPVAGSAPHSPRVQATLYDGEAA